MLSWIMVRHGQHRDYYNTTDINQAVYNEDH